MSLSLRAHLRILGKKLKLKEENLGKNHKNYVASQNLPLSITKNQKNYPCQRKFSIILIFLPKTAQKIIEICEKWSAFLIIHSRLQRRRQDFGSGRGNVLGGLPRRGSGRQSHKDARKFWKFPKNFLRKLQKNRLF